MKTIKQIKEKNIILTEKWDPKKAEQVLRDIISAYQLTKSLGATSNQGKKHIIMRWEDMYYTTYTAWFSSKDMRKLGLPTELK